MTVTAQAPTAPPEIPAAVVTALVDRSAGGRFGGPYSFDEQWKMAEGLAQAKHAVPPMYRGSPGDVLAATMQAHALDVPLSVALQHFYWNPESGKGGMSAQLMSALLLRHGVTWDVTRRDDQRVAMRFSRSDGGPGGEVEWTIIEAVAAGLVRQGSPWEFFPVDCLWARCLSRGARQFGADAVMGMGFTPEEVYASTPEDSTADAGRPVERDVAQLLDGIAEATAANIKDERMEAAKKQGLLNSYAGTVNGSPRTLQQALRDAWLAASHREAAAAADAALPAATEDEAEPAAAVVDEPPAVELPAGEGDLPCGCSSRDVLLTGDHREGCSERASA